MWSGRSAAHPAKKQNIFNSKSRHFGQPDGSRAQGSQGHCIATGVGYWGRSLASRDQSRRSLDLSKSLRCSWGPRVRFRGDIDADQRNHSTLHPPSLLPVPETGSAKKLRSCRRHFCLHNGHDSRLSCLTSQSDLQPFQPIPEQRCQMVLFVLFCLICSILADQRSWRS